MWLLAVLALIVATIAGDRSASAHHDRGVNTVSPSTDLDEGLTHWLHRAGTSWLSFGVDYDLRLVDELVRGDGRTPLIAAPDVTIHSVSLDTSYEFATATTVSLRLPIAHVDGRFEGRSTSTTGLGDMTLMVSQRFRPLGPKGLGLVFGVGTTLPTGARDERVLAAVETLDTTSDASLRVFEYETRTALGSGVAWLRAGVGVQWPIVARLALHASVNMAVPLASAADGTRWGTMADVPLSLVWAAVANRVALRAGVSYSHAGTERRSYLVGDLEKTTVDGSVDRWSATAGVDVRVVGALVWRAGVGVPFAESVDGLQLVDSFNFSIGISWGRAP